MSERGQTVTAVVLILGITRLTWQQQLMAYSPLQIKTQSPNSGTGREAGHNKIYEEMKSDWM